MTWSMVEKKKKKREMTHKITPYIQNIEREKRRKRCAEIRGKDAALQKEINMGIVTEIEGNTPKSRHVRLEEGDDEYLSPMEEYL